MAGRMQGNDCNIANLKFLAIFCNMGWKFCNCFRAVNNWRISDLAKVNMAAYKIGMKMSFKNIADGCFSFIGEIKIYVDVTQGVNNCRFSIAFDIVGCLADATGI